MREIKFRGKRVDNNEWIYGYYVYYSTFNRHDIWVDGTIGDWHEVVPDTVGQFTGLHDKNGKDVYEGDIIKSKSSIGTYTIVWDNCGFKKRGNSDAKSAFNYKNDGIFDIFIYDGDNEEKKDYYKIEVIGNIHENQELLNQKK